MTHEYCSTGLENFRLSPCIGLYKKERPPVKQNEKCWLQICIFTPFGVICVQSDMLEDRQNLRYYSSAERSAAEGTIPFRHRIICLSMQWTSFADKCLCILLQKQGDCRLSQFKWISPSSTRVPKGGRHGKCRCVVFDRCPSTSMVASCLLE